MESKQTLATLALLVVIALSGAYIWRTIRTESFFAAEVGAKEITIISPSGGESWVRGSLQTIRWEAVSVEPEKIPTLTVDLLATGGGTSFSLSTDAQESLEWVVGEYLNQASLFEIPDGTYVVRVCSSGTTVCNQSSQFSLSTPEIVTISWGQEGDEPMPADYNGDGRTDLAVWREDQGRLWVQYLGMYETKEPAGLKQVIEDFDGDGTKDAITWNNDTRSAKINGKTVDLSGSLSEGSYIPVHGDYDGDGKAELALFQPGKEMSATWFIYTKN